MYNNLINYCGRILPRGVEEVVSERVVGLPVVEVAFWVAELLWMVEELLVTWVVVAGVEVSFSKQTVCSQQIQHWKKYHMCVY